MPFSNLVEPCACTICVSSGDSTEGEVTPSARVLAVGTWVAVKTVGIGIAWAGLESRDALSAPRATVAAPATSSRARRCRYMDVSFQVGRGVRHDWVRVRGTND